VITKADLDLAMTISMAADAMMEMQTTPEERAAYLGEQRRLKQAANDAIAARYREERRQRKAILREKGHGK